MAAGALERILDDQAPGLAIERDGLSRWAGSEGVSIESAFQTLVTGLAVRYYCAVAEQR